MSINGIDVSKWQGSIDWAEVKQGGVEFAMIRSSYGLGVRDEYFAENASGAYQAGVYAGAYHYTLARSVQAARDEAEFVLQTIRGYKLQYPVALDMEDSSLEALSVQELTDIAYAFLEAVEDAGYYAILYASKYWLETKLDMERLSRFDIWLAEYREGGYSYSGNVGMWQYTNDGRVAGISGAVDRDIAYRDYERIIREAGLNHLGDDNMTIEQAKQIIQEKVGLDDNTLFFMECYRYGVELLTKIANAVK